MIKLKPAIGFLMVFIVCFTLVTGQEKVNVGGKEYYLHQVKKGEGFYRLSITYGVSQKEIVDANPNLALTGLKEGSVVKVPVIQRFANSGNTSDSDFLFHTVEKGQTLFFISRKYDVSVEQIQQLNPETKQGLIEGAMLKIPLKKPLSTPTPTDKKYREHVVAPGETLFKIAGQYQISAQQLSDANPSLVQANIKPGDKLRIPNVEPVIPKEDAQFKYHLVRSGETLHGIAQQYAVQEEQIVAANETASFQPLEIGKVVRIPKIQAEEQAPVTKIHIVQKKETLYGISKQYSVSEEAIKKINTTQDWGNLRKGDALKIPVFKAKTEVAPPAPVVVEPQDELPNNAFTEACGKYNYEQNGAPEIKVALMLPFDLAALKAANETHDSLKTVAMRAQANKSRAFVEFYEGALLALDTLKKQGARIKWHVYDTNSDSINLNSLLHRHEIGQMQLIIGPAYLSQMKQVAQFAQEKQIPVVFPFTPFNASLRNNPYVYQASPIDTLLQEPILTKMMKNASQKRIVLLSTGSNHAFEARIAKQIKELAYRRTLSEGNTPDFVELRYNPRDIYALEVLLSKEKENLLIIPSVEEAKVSRMLTTIAALTDRSKSTISVFGFSEWTKFQTIEAEDLHKLNTILYAPYGVDYQNAEVKKFAANYRKWFYAEPVAINPYFQSVTSQSRYSRYGMWGYDITNYFIGALMQYGPGFAKCLHRYHPEQIQGNFEFIPITNWGGSYNRGLVQIHFTKDFQTRVTPLQ